MYGSLDKSGKGFYENSARLVYIEIVLHQLRQIYISIFKVDLNFVLQSINRQRIILMKRMSFTKK